jgi:hypothetical protein
MRFEGSALVSFDLTLVTVDQLPEKLEVVRERVLMIVSVRLSVALLADAQKCSFLFTVQSHSEPHLKPRPKNAKTGIARGHTSEEVMTEWLGRHKKEKRKHVLSSD